MAHLNRSRRRNGRAVPSSLFYRIYCDTFAISSRHNSGTLHTPDSCIGSEGELSPPKSGAEMQSDIVAIQSRMTKLEETQLSNHRDNRKDIHDLRGELQKLILTLPEAIRDSMDKMGDKVAKQIADAITPLQNRTEKVEGKVYGIEIQWAKAKGMMAAYMTLGGIGAGLLFEGAKVSLERLIR